MYLKKRKNLFFLGTMLLLCTVPSCAKKQQETEVQPKQQEDENQSAEEAVAIATGEALQVVQTPPIDEEEEASPFAYLHDLPEGEPVVFHEVWGYVMQDREDELHDDMPITDICYFSADINAYGEIESIPKAEKLKAYKGRKHFVVTCESRSLTHFVIDPQYGVSKKLIDTIAKGIKDYDGVQIDFELVPKKDGKHFRDFLSSLRARIGEKKWLTVALPARTRTLENDVYDYAKIAPLVDRIIIMAYDEHWSTSAPGAIASMDWCERIADYAKTVLPKKKLVMGLPFYGRTWQDETLGKAWYFSGINRVMNENKAHVIEREDWVPMFTFKKEITVTGYFDDAVSLVARLRMYADKDIDRVAFWRIGQEDASFWDWLEQK